MKLAKITEDLRGDILIVRRRARMLVANSPTLYGAIARLAGRKTLVTRDTEIVIDGYPRSGNSYAEAWFKLAQERNLNMAHHTHAAAQIRTAIRFCVPAIVLIREPDAAVMSLVLMNRGNLVRRASLCFDEYVQFYTALYPYRDCFVRSEFNRTTSAFGSVIQEVNSRFDRRFSDRLPPGIGDVAVMGKVDDLAVERVGKKTSYSRDRSARERAEQEYRRRAVEEAMDHPSLKQKRREARETYERFVG